MGTFIRLSVYFQTLEGTSHDRPVFVRIGTFLHLGQVYLSFWAS